MSYRTLKVERVNEQIISLKLCRPEKLNAMNVGMFEELDQFLNDLEKDKYAACVVVAGEGENFSSGLDFYDLFDYIKKSDSFNLKRHIEFMQGVFLKVFNSSKVFIAAVDGYCIGAGLDFISACDLRLATTRSKFSVAETRLGIVADLGSLQHLIRIIGEQSARYYSYTSEIFDGKKAFDMGLVFNLCENKEALLELANDIALKVTSNPFKAVSNTKKSMNFSIFNELEKSLEYTANFNLSLDPKQLIERFSKGLK